MLSIPRKIKILLLYVTLATVAGTLSLYIYYQGLSVNLNHRLLSQENLPQFSAISRLGEAFSEHERALYEYYSTQNADVLKKQLQSNNQTIALSLELLQLSFKDTAEMRSLQMYIDEHNQITEQLQFELQSDIHGKWDRARALLEKLTASSQYTNPILENLITDVNALVNNRQLATEQQVKGISVLVTLFSGLILIIALISGWQVTTRLKEAREKKRLSLFIERNPNPVMSVDWQGKVRYLNPAWEKLQSLMETSLSPDNFPEHIHQLKNSDRKQSQWIFEIENKTFQATLSKQEEIRSLILYLEDISQRKKAENELEFLAFNDPLTSLPNRKKLEMDAERWIDIHPENHLTVVVISIERFNQITASHGFKVGDQILLAIKDRIDFCINDMNNHSVQANLYRFTGAKFVLTIQTTPDIDARELTLELIDNIQSAMLAFIANAYGHFYMQLRFGISYYPAHSKEFSTLLQDADTACSIARKNDQGSIVEFDQEMVDKERHWFGLEVDLRGAMVTKEFKLVYQPKIDLKSGEIKGAEALIRWNNEHRGFVSPAEFIPVAEQSGLIIEIGRWVLQEACRQTVAWQKEHGIMLQCAVNISPMQFLHHEFIAMVEKTLRDEGLIPSQLELEITEGVLMSDINRSKDILKELHKKGISIAIDDFGTGYSSLAYLKSFKLDKLKIDKSFVDNITTNENDRAIIQTIINLARHLNLKVIAEGVETQDQLAQLVEYDCDEIQGYVFSKPLPPEQLIEFAQSKN